jgi:integrase
VGDQWITTNIKVHPDFWDAENSIISKKHPRYYTINPTFTLYKSRAEQCISNYQTSGDIFNREYFETCIFKGQEDAANPLFFPLITEYVSLHSLSWGRTKQYTTLQNDISSLIINPRINDITYLFALKLQNHLKNKEKPNNINTITTKLKKLKALVHHAQKKGLLKEDPLQHLKLKEVEGSKKFLTADELEKLEKLFAEGTLPGSLQQCLRYFLFSCYTALRYSDITILRLSSIKNNMVTTTQQKTDKEVSIPLIPQAKALLQPTMDGMCFKTFTNQATNRFLKDIMEAAGIDKKITYHCSRHTFGTLSIYWGIPMDIVAELMGIDMKTVEIYAKIFDQVKVREMGKWERKTG